MVMVLYLVHYETALHNTTDIITKCDSYFIRKCERTLSIFFLIIEFRRIFLYMSKCVRFFITKCSSFVIKWDSYYKMRRLLQNALVQ